MILKSDGPILKQAVNNSGGSDTCGTIAPQITSLTTHPDLSEKTPDFVQRRTAGLVPSRSQSTSRLPIINDRGCTMVAVVIAVCKCPPPRKRLRLVRYRTDC